MFAHRALMILKVLNCNYREKEFLFFLFPARIRAKYTSTDNETTCNCVRWKEWEINTKLKKCLKYYFDDLCIVYESRGHGRASRDVNGSPRQTGIHWNRRHEDNHRLRSRVLFTLLISQLPLAQEDVRYGVMIWWKRNCCLQGIHP